MNINKTALLLLLLASPSLLFAARPSINELNTRVNQLDAEIVQLKAEDVTLHDRIDNEALKRLMDLENRLQNTDFDNDGFAPAAGDCNDSDPSINPAVAEICGDGIDNNCNAVIDENCTCADQNACDDGVSCTIDTCDPILGCTNITDDSACDDGSFCNGVEVCTGLGCSVSSGDPCAGIGVCNEATDSCE